MIVTFVSQCEKRALKRTRQVLDAYANRIGDNVWQTIITEEGLLMVKKLLRRTATKNSAISCHWIRSRRRTNLLWIVGNRNKFNSEGIVPVNTTQKDFQLGHHAHLWQNLELITVASSIAGLFHDFGKASQLFQDKINPDKTTKSYEPYRHEWISLRIFETWVRNKSNEEWLKLLEEHDQSVCEDTINTMYKDGVLTSKPPELFEGLTDFAKLIAWLIVSHHRLLIYPLNDSSPSLKKTEKEKIANKWFRALDAKWNSPNSLAEKHEWSISEFKRNWHFEYGLPWESIHWQSKARQICKRAKQIQGQLDNYCWDDGILTAHLARLVLMQADHHYSASDVTHKWQDAKYLAYANSDKNRQLKQKLDEHNIGVAQGAYLTARSLPAFLDELPTIGINSILVKGIPDGDPTLSLWQNLAVKESKKLQIESNECGFFGINMASTGKGKTLANARIMYAIADEEKGCRLSIALGLRTLTTQTASALKKSLHLGDDEIATLIGSSAIQRLLNLSEQGQQTQEQQQLLKDLEQSMLSMIGSESLDDGGEELFIDYLEIESDSLLKKWFTHDRKIQKLLHAPILVSTIDHLVPSTEGTRGGRQITPMLRLLSSDLILDEPDEFGLDDLPALSRLVHWSGLLGGKVLLSSATIPPAMACALFDAYKSGREIYNQSMSSSHQKKSVVCGWFDEFNSSLSSHSSVGDYKKAHERYVNDRIGYLKVAPAIHKAKIVEIEGDGNNFEKLAQTIYQNILVAHDQHKICSPSGQLCSFGVVRIANIHVLVKVARLLAQQILPNNVCFHLCVYHSRFTLAQRSYIESKLDDILNRKDELSVWKKPEMIEAMAKSPNSKQHVFIVLATSVAEVGRDHDYDWAIAEPSSMRSIIQLSGRVQRHRKKAPKDENIFILNMNYRALDNQSPAYCKPGFEHKKGEESWCFDKNNGLKSLLKKDQYEVINAIPSIKLIPLGKNKSGGQYKFTNFVELEQSAYWFRLMGLNESTNNCANIWWRENLSWFGELQRQQPFRKSQKDIALVYMYAQDSRNVYRWHKKQEQYPYQFEEMMNIQEGEDVIWGNNIYPWFDMNETVRYEVLEEQLGLSLSQVQKQYGEVRIIADNKQYYYQSFLGVYSD